MNNFKYYVFYKPYGVLSQFTSDNPEEALSKFRLPKDIYAAGRLDKDSEGLLLLTNDGQFIHSLLNPKFDKEKTYLAQVEKIPNEEDIFKLTNGLKIENYITKKCSARLLTIEPELPPRVPPIRERKTIPTAWIEIKITEGKNRQVRKMTAAIGFPTLRLIRIQIGKVKLDKLLPGEYREISKDDVI